MPRYIFDATSPVDGITIVTNEAGTARAYLHANPNADPKKLYDSVCKLNEQNWQSIPFILQDGTPVLEVRNFKKDSALISFLQEQGLAHGEPKLQPLKEDEVSFMDQVKKRMLQASGAFYFLGDLCYATYGWKEAHWEDMLASAFYSGGTLCLVGFGRNDQSDLQIKDIAQKMDGYFLKNRMEMPDGCTASALVDEHKNRDLTERTEEMFRRYPSEMFSFFTGLAGLMVATSAARHRAFAPPRPGADAKEVAETKREGKWDLGLGTLTMLSCATGGLVQEKKHDPDEPEPKNIVDQAVRWVREKPLRVAGYGLMASTLFHAKSTVIAMQEAIRLNDKKRMRSVPFRGGFVGANLIAEFLMSISSKGHGEGVKSDNTVDKSVLALAAEMIAKQKPELREELIAHMSRFLGDPTIFAEKDEDLEKDLRKLVDAQLHNPWAGLNRSLEAGKGMPFVNASSAMTPIVPQTWQQKISLAPALAPQLHERSGMPA